MAYPNATDVKGSTTLRMVATDRSAAYAVLGSTVVDCPRPRTDPPTFCNCGRAHPANNRHCPVYVRIACARGVTVLPPAPSRLDHPPLRPPMPSRAERRRAQQPGYQWGPMPIPFAPYAPYAQYAHKMPQWPVPTLMAPANLGASAPPRRSKKARPGKKKRRSRAAKAAAAAAERATAGPTAAATSAVAGATGAANLTAVPHPTQHASCRCSEGSLYVYVRAGRDGEFDSAT